MSSMIHSARPTIRITVISLEDFVLRDFEKWGRTDRRTEVQTPRAKIVINACRDCGSAEWINKKLLGRMTEFQHTEY